MLLFSLILISTELQAAVIAADAEAEGECDNTDKLRLVTMEELETYAPSLSCSKYILLKFVD
jgi:hypothetical protein